MIDLPELTALLAQTVPSGLSAPTTASTQPDIPWWVSMVRNPMNLLLVGVVIFYIWLFRQRKGEDKARTKALASLKKGDRVVTIGGEIGTVMQADDREVTLKVDESANVKIRYTRSAIHRVLDDDKAADKTPAK